MTKSTIPLLVAALLYAAPAFAQTAPASSAKTSAEDEAVKLSIFTVSEEKDLGYESMQTTSGMRTVQELKNVANSISIMNSQLIDDLGVTNIEEMSKWFVTGEQSPDPAQPNQLIFRGVRNSYAIRNGWIWYSPMDSYATERVELLRGPNAFLYGEADLGGANNQVTKRGLLSRNFTRARLMLGTNLGSFDTPAGYNMGDDSLRRVELDFNRVLKRNVLAVRVATVQHNGGSWVDHGRRDFRGVYGAVTYRPFRATRVSLMAEHAKNTLVASQGLFLDNYSFNTVTTLTNTGGVIFVPATGAIYRANTQRRSNGTGLTAVDSALVSRTLQVNGPNATNKNYYDSVTLEIEQDIGHNLHLQFSGNFYQQQQDIWGAAASRNIFRDLSPTLPGGATNPNFNQLYTEYFRTRNMNGNVVRDMRFSAIYDLNLKWTKQQFAFNVQQHQDSPGQKKPKFGEYVDPSNPLFVGTINPAVTQAAFTANRTTFTSNRFMRRYYLNGGDGAELTSELGPKPGVSAYYPDLSNLIGAGGNIIERRFYTPSVGVGASGSYFNNHLFTLAGYREDRFNMKSTFGAVQPIKDQWVNEFIPGSFAPNPAFVHYKVNGSNLGAVLRVNDTLAFAYNRAKSFRISVGEGNDLFTPGIKQAIPTGEGQDASIRLTLFGGRMEFNTTYYDNYQPNARISPAPAINIRDELSATFGSSILVTGTDYQKLSTKGYEMELVANLTRTWRLILNGATNDLVTKDRLPLLKAFQAEAKAASKPTPLLDAFLLTFPEDVPTAGYTKTRINLFTRYEIPSGKLRGVYFGGGANWREQTFRGNAVVVQGGPVESLWSPAYYTVSLLGGYRAKVFDRMTTFALNVDNAFNKDYYLSATTTTGSWGAPRSFRFTMAVDF